MKQAITFHEKGELPEIPLEPYVTEPWVASEAPPLPLPARQNVLN